VVVPGLVVVGLLPDLKINHNQNPKKSAMGKKSPSSANKQPSPRRVSPSSRQSSSPNAAPLKSSSFSFSWPVLFLLLALLGALSAWILASSSSPFLASARRSLEGLLYSTPSAPLSYSSSSKSAPKQQAEKAGGTRKKKSSSHGADVPAIADELATLTPAAEREIGVEGSLQRALMTGPTPFTTLIVVNEAGTKPVDVFWNGQLITMAAPGYRARVESWIGHELLINNETFVLDGSFAAVIFKGENLALERVAQVLPEKPKPQPKHIELSTTAKAIKIRNLSKYRFHEFWVPDNDDPPSYQGVIEPHSETTTNSYLTHRFRFTDLKDKSKIVYEFRVNADEDVYAYVDRKTADPQQLLRHDEEMVFAKDYLARTGRHWYSYYRVFFLRLFKMTLTCFFCQKKFSFV